MDEKKILALYDFASKQNFIYRTSKIREISGASAMLAEAFKKFPAVLEADADCNVVMKYDLSDTFTLDKFNNGAADAEVLYDGGGSLMVLYKSREKYVEANRAVSKNLLLNYPTLSLIACGVEYTGDFKADRERLYAENARRKNCYPASDIPAVTPVTQVDPSTFMPVVKKVTVPYEQSLSADRAAKQKCFIPSENDKLESLEGLTAVIYIDGNSMGQKLKKCESEFYEDGVARLRSFSKNVHELFVTAPLDAISKATGDTGYRQVIGGGDEITIICQAEKAWDLVCKYFETLGSKDLEITDMEGKVVSQGPCYSCAGIAVFHSKTPFNIVYEIAEAACESAKEKSRTDNGNYVDFYYYHAGITDDFKSLRKAQQVHATARPYKFEEAKATFERLAPVLRKAERSNVKALGSAAQESYERYMFEVKRVNAYLPADSEKFSGTEEEMRTIYDMSEFYDLWFAKEG